MENSEVPKGTTTVGVVCSDGIILGADTRATMGYFIASKEADKVLPIQDHLAMTIAGGVGDAQTLNRLMKAESSLYNIQRKEKISVKGASTLLGTILQQSKYFPYWVQILVGGIDHDGAQLYSVDMAGGVMAENFVSTGSGSPTAYGVLEDRYSKNKKVDEILPLVIRALNAAMKRDAASGDGLNIGVINKDGFRKLSKKEIEEITEKNSLTAPGKNRT